MRIFSILLVPALLVSISHVAAVDKRAISNAAQLCNNDISSFAPMLETVEAETKKFDSSKGFAGGGQLNFRMYDLELATEKAMNSCCVSSINTFNVEETEAILDIVGASTPKYISAVDALLLIKPEVDKVLALGSLYQGRLQRIGNRTTILDTCLLSKIPDSPPTYKETASAHFTSVKNKIDFAASKYKENPSVTRTSSTTATATTTVTSTAT